MLASVNFTSSAAGINTRNFAMVIEQPHGAHLKRERRDVLLDRIFEIIVITQHSIIELFGSIVVLARLKW